MTLRQAMHAVAHWPGVSYWCDGKTHEVTFRNGAVWRYDPRWPRIPVR